VGASLVTDGGAPDDVVASLCLIFANLCTVGQLQVEFQFVESVICAHSDSDFSVWTCSRFCEVGLEIEGPTVKDLFDILGRSKRNHMTAPLLSAVHGIISTDARNAISF
jgi:uncharacterized membrane protein